MNRLTNEYGAMVTPLAQEFNNKVDVFVDQIVKEAVALGLNPDEMIHLEHLVSCSVACIFSEQRLRVGINLSRKEKQEAKNKMLDRASSEFKTRLSGIAKIG